LRKCVVWSGNGSATLRSRYIWDDIYVGVSDLRLSLCVGLRGEQILRGHTKEPLTVRKVAAVTGTAGRS
jgi:hypothetical protein